jgi:hypothetical protein
MTISGEDLNARPIAHSPEILEATPGLAVVQHSGSGKANQYYLRGYNLDHGTDMAIFWDDVPINLPTSGYQQLELFRSDRAARHYHRTDRSVRRTRPHGRRRYEPVHALQEDWGHQGHRRGDVLDGPPDVIENCDFEVDLAHAETEPAE